MKWGQHILFWAVLILVVIGSYTNLWLNLYNKLLRSPEVISDLIEGEDSYQVLLSDLNSAELMKLAAVDGHQVKDRLRAKEEIFSLKRSQNLGRDNYVSPIPINKFGREFTLLAEIQIADENGDLFGNLDCSDSRLLIHAPHAESFYVQVGKPTVNAIVIPREDIEGDRVVILLSKEMSGNFHFFVNHIGGTSVASSIFEQDIIDQLWIGNSGCNIPFQGKIYSLEIYRQGLGWEEAVALQRLQFKSK